ncbi:G2/mitotic-specific cyclin-B3 [Aplysia californica]|uniref:G2/mitotic-specific cyclin-B3 n=1 Tax=Aplysia californica TaxID=6500 RepID=A0ABM0JS85_APLCA|nr:G2/mitotic-specific cyclin-B3 [Aplysia californica]
MFARKKPTENPDPLPRGLRAKKVPGVEAPVKPGLSKLKRPTVGQTKRSAFGDITNAAKEKVAEGKKTQGLVKPTSKSSLAGPVKAPRNALKKPIEVKKRATEAKSSQEVNSSTSSVSSALASSQESTKNETSQALKNLAAGVPVDREEEDFSFIDAEDLEDEPIAEVEEKFMPTVDLENYSDVFNIGIYAQDIFDYYKCREQLFQIPSYLDGKSCKITPIMRAILVDWMVEIQENFELNHETLYLAVKLSDTYLSREPQEKEMLQLVGAASVFIASKFDERCPPLIEDFTYICDNSFDRDQFILMEMEILRKVDFDLGIPISYRFLRRYAKVARSSMVTLTLARFILEMSLMEYSLITERDSRIAAAALYIAMKMSKEGEWEGEVVQSSGYTVEKIKDMVLALNTMLHARPIPQLSTIRSKYSHIVFHEVAKIKPLPTALLL